jgi:probable HAF family extracellular repeat protein
MRRFLVLLGLFFIVAARALAAEPLEVVDLGTLNGEANGRVRAFGLNEQRQVTGYGFLENGVNLAFLFANGTIQNLGSHLSATGGSGLGPFSSAFDINESGVVVGSACCFYVSVNPVRATRWQNGVWTLLPSTGLYSEARGINDFGQMVGVQNVPEDGFPNGRMLGALWEGANPAIALPGIAAASGSGYASEANAINDPGQIVGTCSVGNSITVRHACRWGVGGSGPTDLGTLGGTTSEGQDLDAAGRVVGWSQLAPAPGQQSGPMRAFVWNGAMQELSLPDGATSSRAYGINESGDVVGTAWTPGGGSDLQGERATLWRNGQAIDLNDLLPAGSPWRLVRALDIADNGDIVGVGTLNGVLRERGFLLSTGPGFTLTVSAETPQPQGVRSRDPIRFLLDAQAGDRVAATLTVTATFRTDLLIVDPDSISAGGVLGDGEITWTLHATSGTTPPLEFEATVNDFIPETILFIPMSASAHAEFDDGAPADAADGVTLTFLKSGLTVFGEAVSPRGDHALPEDEVRFVMQAGAPEPTDEIVVEATVPAGTTLVASSITQGGAYQKGSTRVRWRFTDLAQTPVLEFRVRVDPAKKLPKDLEKIESVVEARGDFDGVPETTSTTLGLDLVRPTTVRGVVRDIVFAYPKKNGVDTKGLPGVEVRLRDGAGTVVDEMVSESGGKFSVDAGKPGHYTLEASMLGDVYAPATDTIDVGGRRIRAEHEIDLEAENQARLDGIPIPADPKKGLAPVDVYVPVTLVRQASDLMLRTRHYDVTYLFLVPIDIGPLLGDLARYEMDEAFAVLDAAIDLDFINPNGTRAHFQGLYEGAGDKDGWNAVIRLCGFLVQLEKRVNEAAQLADAIGKAVALAVTTHFISNVLPKQTDRWKTLLGGRTQPPLEGSTAMIEKAIKTGKIGSMAFGVGLALPNVLEAFGIGGQDKAAWIEALAKGARYGVDLIARRYLPGALREDLTFEEIFNLLRIGTLIAVLELYVDGPPGDGDRGTQGELDGLAELLALGVYAGSTAHAMTLLDTIDAEVTERTLQVKGFFAAVLGDISIIRGAEGVLGISTAFLKQPPSASNPFAAFTKFFKDEAVAAGGNIKKWSAYVVPIQYTLVIGTLVNELIVRATDVIRLHAAAFSATELGTKVRAADLPGITLPPPSTPPEETRAAKFKPPKVPKGPPTAEVQTYVAMLNRVLDAVGDKDAHAYGAARLELLAAHDALFAAFDPLCDRAALAFPGLAEPGRTNVLSFVEARNGVAQAVAAAYSFLETWVEFPSDTKLASPTKTALKLLRTRVGDAAGFFGPAGAALAGLTLPGGLVVRAADQVADRATVLSGAPFALSVVVANPGDGPTEGAEAELIVGDTLELASAATQPVEDLEPGDAVVLTWNLHALPASSGGFFGGAQVVVRRGGVIVATGNELVAEFDPQF